MERLKFNKYRTYIHCKTKEEINVLLQECNVLTNEEDLLAGWKKYGDKIVCEILFDDAEDSDFRKPTICSYGPITDRAFKGKKILMLQQDGKGLVSKNPCVPNWDAKR